MHKDKHLSDDKTFDAAYAIFETLNQTCPGCAMGVVSMLLSMLCIDFVRILEKDGQVFNYKQWMNDMIAMSSDAVDRYDEHTKPTVN